MPLSIYLKVGRGLLLYKLSQFDISMRNYVN